MKKIAIYILGLLAVVNIAGCDESKLELTSQSSYDYSTYFTTSDGLNQAVIATYATLLHDGLWSREYYFIFDLLGYDAKKTTNLQGDMAQLADYSFGTSQTQIGQLWNSLYRLILRSNVVIDRANVWAPTVAADQANAKQYIAEARFLRSYAYFNIVNLWGKAPLITTYDSTVANNYFPRAATGAMWSFIENDLTLAVADLPLTYPAATGLGRATKGAALALLGKTYLYQGKFAQAQATFTQLTTAPYAYTLDTSYDNLFSTSNQSSPENIFQVMNAAWTDWGIGNQYYVFGGQETWGGKATHSDRAQEYGFNDWFNVYVTTAAVKAFKYTNPATGSTYTDPRAYSTFYGSAESGGDTVYCEKCASGKISFPFKTADPQGYYVWRKYEYYNEVATYGGPASSINGQVIRYADVLLMLAESYIKQGKTGAEPLALINQVRKRVNAFQYTTLGASQSDAMAVLMRERQLEFTGEQTRYFDLIRWGIAKQTINATRAAEPGDGKSPFQDKNVLLPIPDVEKNYNPNVAKDIANSWN
ncbi:RagB/SusD family nutrient uptake outer membrane protein [Dyadobacter frigoris]|uniref:RagB/SusD family nutrient uptake outer membrane protein n=1 Tax=Dyadobacter frigoris TaxID=2576211 RepID=A0A4U6CV05_9BACT|nr:RagB/SusD family nutrient uptake outer membrane protein [Dyadobacter frigoris]TKT88106.1 RagB/SusD family nutrient uptake outer membrane protein [Dyadobacter frigoris]